MENLKFWKNEEKSLDTLVKKAMFPGGEKAIEKLKKEKSFGIYANSSIYKKNNLEGFLSDSDEWHYHNHQPIDHVEYKDFVIEWINNGASVIGGCCRTTTDHIREIKNIVDKL